MSEADRPPEARSTPPRPAPSPHLTPLDLLVYAPTGLAISVLEDLPEMAAKGRARIEREIRSARAMGKFAVDHAPRFLAARAGSPSGGRPPERPATPRSPAAPRGVSVSGRRAEPVTAPREATPGAARRPPVGPRPETRTTVDHAIPGYDSLSASQVVRRLDSLTPAELEAVVRHESATRGRRTILHRAEQLLGQGQSPPSAGGVDPAHA